MLILIYHRVKFAFLKWWYFQSRLVYKLLISFFFFLKNLSSFLDAIHIQNVTLIHHNRSNYLLFPKEYYCPFLEQSHIESHIQGYVWIQFLMSLDKHNRSVGSPCGYVKPSQHHLLAVVTAPFDTCIVRSSAWWHITLLSNVFKGSVFTVASWKRHASELLQRLSASMVTGRKVRLSPNVSRVKRECQMSKAAAELVPVLFIFNLIQKHQLNLVGNLEKSEHSSSLFREQ